MAPTALDHSASGRVEYEHLTDGIFRLTFIGDIDVDLLQQSSDRIVDVLNSGGRRVMLRIADANPLFSPIEVVDEFHRAFATPVHATKFASVSPENLFGRYFMLIEAAAFNAGVTVKFVPDEDAARDWLTRDDD
jgi:hypothetical protein